MIKSYLLFMMLFLSGVATAQISINEILADNEKLVIDPETGNYSDFIELYNSGASTADLSGFSLSDSPDNITKWLFPEGTTIAGNGYLIIWADNTSVGLHTNFKLNSSGETITLANTQGKIVSKVTFSSQLPNKPSGQFPEGSGNWVTFDAPTPGAQNTALRLPSTPTSSVSAGFYQSAQTVALTSPSGDQIYYTTDGSEPTAASAQYSEPLTIYSTAVVKATSFNKSARGKTLIMSIFIHERAFDLP